MTSAFSFHVIYDAIDHDPNPLRMAIASLRPRVINIVGGARKTQAFTFAVELQKKYPNMRVIFRNYPDDGLHAIDKYKLVWHRDTAGNLIVDDYSGCQRWVDDNQNYLLAGLTVLTDNESVNDNMDMYAAWQAKIMDLCGTKSWKVAVGRFAVGNPREADYARMKVMWQALAKWHPLHTWSTNEYIPQDIAFAGGMIGRYQLGINAAKAIGAWPFDVSIGEYGVVYRKPDGGLDANAGYKDNRINWTGTKAFRYLFDNWTKWYKANSVDACIYCWGGDGSDKWERFRVDNDNDFIKALLDSAGRGELTPMEAQATAPTKPNYPPQVFTPGEKYTLQAADNSGTNVRTAPIVDATNKIGNALPDKSIVKLLEERSIGVDYWMKISTDTIQEGWLSRRGGAVTFTPVPVIIDPPPVVIPTPEPEPVPTETLYTYTMSFKILSPVIPANRLTAMENGIKAILAGVVSLGAGLGNSEIDVHIVKAN